MYTLRPATPEALPPAAEGRGSLVDAHTVKVELSAGGTRTLTAKYILLALGGKPVKAPIPGAVRSTPTIAPCQTGRARGLGMPQVLMTCAPVLPGLCSTAGSLHRQQTVGIWWEYFVNMRHLFALRYVGVILDSYMGSLKEPLLQAACKGMVWEDWL